MSFSVETKTSSYKLPLVLAIIAHGLLIWFVFMNVDLSSPTQVTQKPRKQVDIVKAVAINQMQVNDEVAKLKAAQQRKAQQQKVQQQKLQALAQQAAQARAREQARLHKLKAEQAKIQKQQVQKQRAAEQRLAKIKQQQATQQQHLAKLKQQRIAQEKQQALRKQQLAEQQKQQAKAAALKKQQAAAELKKQQAAKQAAARKAALEKQQQAQAQARAQQLQGVINKYAVMIKQSIEQRWIIPDNINKNMSTKLQVRLAPGGTVVDVRVIHSSGDSRLDRSARAAVFKASPLPVPTEAQMFERFRVLNLTLRPEGVLAAG